MFSDVENKGIDQIFINKKAVFSCITDNINGELEFKCIDKLLSFEHYKMLTGLIERNDILLVLIDSYTKNPIAFKFYKNNNAYIYKIKYYYDDIKNIGVDFYLDMEEDYFSERYQIRFCIKKANEKLKRVYPYYGLSRFSDNDFQAIKSAAIKNYTSLNGNTEESIQFVNISDSKELEEYIFYYYKLIYSYCNSVIRDNKIFNNISDSCYLKKERDSYIFSQIYKEMLYEIIKECIVSTILSEADKIKADNKTELAKWLAENQKDEGELTDIIFSLIESVFHQIF